MKRGYVVLFAAAQAVGLVFWEAGGLLQDPLLLPLSVLLLLPGSLVGVIILIAHLYSGGFGFFFKLGFGLVFLNILLFALVAFLVNERRKSN